jgi:hypothetical protein
MLGGSCGTHYKYILILGRGTFKETCHLRDLGINGREEVHHAEAAVEKGHELVSAARLHGPRARSLSQCQCQLCLYTPAKVSRTAQL